ncbi:MAG: UDP-3-O-acyl-N-acetylglucosamine deacetylase [Gemmatales bacterium]|nr:UDP-3-O-acyl-N-acetylglucosamine deacetylase [Gemmatales bacterium]MDW8175227.1 UDP-3-O-acyl-N-acetylglucosamine deacetylase [Gemmatales bacterium]
MTESSFTRPFASASTTSSERGNALSSEPELHVVGWRKQRTLAKPIELTGRGLLYGRRVRLRLLPAEADTGRVFVRTDRSIPAVIPAIADAVTATDRRTVLGTPPVHVELVEHVLAALAGMMVDNCRIELDGPEPPGWDGSVRPLVHALKEVGFSAQRADLPIVTVRTTLEVCLNSSRIVFLPSTASTYLEIDYFLDYGTWSVIAPQRFSCRATPQDFLNALAASRTFLLLEEVQALRHQGLGIHTGPEHVLVFTQRGVLGNRLRWADEAVRHKILDLIGDLALIGWPLAGRLVAYRSGHRLNVHLAQQIRRAGRTTRLGHLLSASAA